MKNILFTAFESLPFVKVGGLADVVYALPKSINANKYRVKVALPLFKPIKSKYKNKLKHITDFNIKSGKINERIHIYSFTNESIEYLFIDNNHYFNRKDVYGYKDDGIRFALYSLAVIEMMINTNYYPNICHEHDYHTSMIPAICKIKYNDNKNIRKIKHVFTIHNLVYQGWYKNRILVNWFGFDKTNCKNSKLIIRKACNFMKAGICYSDAVTTVSKTYSKEIQTSKYGYGLNHILEKNKRKLSGIVNGIDIKLFNPTIDKNIIRYNITNYSIGKRKNKLQIQKEFGLNLDSETLLVGMVSRLTFQKGADLMLACMNKILKTNVQIVVLGTGESKIEEKFKNINKNHNKQFGFYCGYNENLAHKIYAGVDLLLMPSLFEPCGISQLISMRYGTLPLVRETGGLKDTVIKYNKKNCNGFSFKNYKIKDFYETYMLAYSIFYKQQNVWKKIVKNAMKTNVSFTKSAKEYELLYDKVLHRK